MKAIILTIISVTILSCTNSNSKSMGVFGKLFGKENQSEKRQDTNLGPNLDVSKLTKTAEMLDEDLYWTIIEKSLKNTNNQEGQEQYLIKEISNLTPKQMVGFRLRTDKLLYDTYNSEMWCAAYIMNGGCSDDCFEYFRNWVISRGKDTYYKAKQHPDNLITQVSPNMELYDFEDFWYVSNEAFEQKTGQDLYDYIDDENFKTREGHYPDFEFTWQEENPESMQKICPHLFAKLWNN